MRFHLSILPASLLSASLFLASGCSESAPPRRLSGADPAVPAPAVPAPAVRAPSPVETAEPVDTTTAIAANDAASPENEPLEPSTTEPSATEPTAAESSATELAAAPAAGPAAAKSRSGMGTFQGRVSVEGDVPELPPVLAKGAVVKDAICAQNAIPDESIIVGPEGGLANVFVYMRKVPDGMEIPAPPEEPAIIDQKNCMFVPHAAIFRVGQEIRLQNSDPFPHNTHTNPFKNEAINPIIQGNNTEGIPHKYERAETLPVKTNCDIHAWMVSWHLPLDHPWAALTDAGGNFAVTNLPPGEYEFRLWHEKVGYVEKGVDVKITADQAAEHDFTVTAADLQK